MIKETVMETGDDRFVTPTLTMGDLQSARRLGLQIPTLDDDANVYLDVAPKAHHYNYPALSGGDYASAGVVLEFRFDDADGTTITDSANGLILTEQGDPDYQQSADTPGLGHGVAYDGTGDAHDVLIEDVPPGIIPTTGDFTVEVVCKLTSGSGGAGDTIIACRDGAAGVGWQLQLDANEYLDVHIEDADGQVAQEGATDVATDSIVHIVCSFDRSGNLVTYLDGASNKTTAISSKEKTVFPGTSADARLSIGGDAARTGGDCLTGEVYFVRLYNRALAAAEVKDNYNILMNQGYPGWVPLLNRTSGTDLLICKSGSDPGYYDLTAYLPTLQGVSMRARCSVEQTATNDLDFVWIYA